MRGTLGRILDRKRRRKTPQRTDPRPDPALLAVASSALTGYAETHATLIERAERLEEKSSRLETSGTPSESARNRADRAWEEVEAGLADLRENFAANGSAAERLRAFDLEAQNRYPMLGPWGAEPRGGGR